VWWVAIIVGVVWLLVASGLIITMRDDIESLREIMVCIGWPVVMVMGMWVATRETYKDRKQRKKVELDCILGLMTSEKRRRKGRKKS
jgi:choline-glycine betaine transporter